MPKLTVELADFQFQDEKLQVGRFELAGSASVKDPSARRRPLPGVDAAGHYRRLHVAGGPARPRRRTEQRPGRGPAESHRPAEPAPTASQLRLQLERVDLGKWASLVPSLRVEGLVEANLQSTSPRSRGAEPCARHDRGQSARGQGCARELLRARRVEAKGLEVDWPSRLAARQLVITGPRGTIERDSTGGVALPSGLPGQAAPGTAGSPPAAPAPPLALAVGEIVVKDGGLVWRDRAVKPDVALEFVDLEAKVTGAAWPLHGPLGVRVGARPPGGGRVEFDGRVGVDPITAEGRVTGSDADLAPYQAYAPLPARIGGRVHFDLAVALPPVAEGRAIAAGPRAASLIDVRDGERTVMRVERAQATGVDIDWPRRVAVRDLTLQRPWVLLERDQGGALTLRTLLSPRAPDGSAPGGSARSASAPIRPLPASSGGSTVPITVDHLVVADRGARTVDHRVAPPIALDTQRLTGRIDGLSTDPAPSPPAWT